MYYIDLTNLWLIDMYVYMRTSCFYLYIPLGTFIVSLYTYSLFL